jgi:hypothetical protein
MSALLTETTRALGLSGTTSVARTAVGVVAMAVLLALLVGRDMARVGARAEPASERARRISDLRLAIVPLTLVFAGVLAPRLMELVR